MITWRDQMSVDGGIIDSDHRHLIEIINKFEERADGEATEDELIEILYALKFYASTHFKREETLQRLTHYPHHDRHCQEHKELAARLEAIIADTRKALAGDTKKAVAETGALLKSWLVDHVIGSDLRMSSYIHAARKAGEAMELLGDVPWDGSK
jgi:hemerythrin-like metal-binding protein